ncbi:MAG: hypothetical protein ACI4RT_01795 [Candidatus Spyradenecus sp.]
MKETILIPLVKLCAKVALDHIGDLVVWLVKLSADAVAQNETLQQVIAAAEAVATNAGQVAAVLKDGQVTAEEEATLKTAAEACAKQVKALL